MVDDMSQSKLELSHLLSSLGETIRVLRRMFYVNLAISIFVIYLVYDQFTSPLATLREIRSTYIAPLLQIDARADSLGYKSDYRDQLRRMQDGAKNSEAYDVISEAIGESEGMTTPYGDRRIFGLVRSDMDSLLEEYGKRLEVLWSGDLENHPIGELPHVLQAVKADDLWLTDRLLVRAREKPGRTRQRAPPGPATDEQADGVVATLNAVMLGPGKARQETAGTIRTMTWFQGLSDPDTSDERIAHDFFELASSVEKIPDPDAFASRLEELEYSCRRQELDPCTLRRLSERLSQGVPAFSVPMLPATAERLDLFLALPLVLLVSFHLFVAQAKRRNVLRNRILHRVSENELQLVEESWLLGNLLISRADDREPGVSGTASRLISYNWQYVNFAFLVVAELLPTIAVFAIILYGGAAGGESGSAWELCWRIAAWLVALINLTSVASLWRDQVRELMAVGKQQPRE
jgi:hypothetical protein